jgi:ATP-binding cassette subfamily D (ALD) protein 2
MKLKLLTGLCLQITELAGYTSRVYNMFTVFDDVLQGKYRRTVVVKDNQPKLEKSNLEKIEGPVEAHGNLVLVN